MAALFQLLVCGLILAGGLLACGLVEPKYENYDPTVSTNTGATADCAAGQAAFAEKMAPVVKISGCSCHGSQVPKWGEDAAANRLLMLAATRRFNYTFLTVDHPGKNQFKAIAQADFKVWVDAEQGQCGATP